LALCQIAHAKRYNDGYSDVQKPGTKEKIPFEVGAVDYGQHKIWWPSAAMTAKFSKQSPRRDLFVNSVAVEAVCPGQVYERYCSSAGERESAFLLLDGNAGIVSDLIPEASEGIEE